jgi:hypothetical protein
MGYDGWFGMVVLSLLHARPKAAMMAAPAMHVSVRISVFFIGAFSPTIAVDYIPFILFCSPNATQLHFIRAKTKSILELTIIDVLIDDNCH